MPAIHSEKQKKAFEIVQRTGKPVKHAMLEAGYSKWSANVPKELTDSVSWRNMLAKKLPEDYILKRHKYLLERKDGASVSKGLDMYYKMRKFYQEENQQGGNIQVQIINYANKMLQEQGERPIGADDIKKVLPDDVNANDNVVSDLDGGAGAP